MLYIDFNRTNTRIPEKGSEHRQRVPLAQRRLVAVAVVADGDQQLQAHALDWRGGIDVGCERMIGVIE